MKEKLISFLLVALLLALTTIIVFSVLVLSANIHYVSTIFFQKGQTMSIVPGQITEDMPAEDVDYQEDYDDGSQGVNWSQFNDSHDESKEE